MKLVWGLVLSVGLAVFVSAGRLDCRNTAECEEQRMHPSLPKKVRANAGPENSQSYWIENGKKYAEDVMKQVPNKKVAKNVIFFIGDGMSLTTLAATRVLLGGEEKQLSFEAFPHVGLSKTYSIDRIVPDSASTATAYLCGVKGNYYTIGVNGRVSEGNCETMADPANQVTSIAHWAMDAGKAAGLVTTTRVTHASPSGVFAHTSHRNWENDAEIKKNCPANTKATDIAYQLVHGETGKRLKVIMGGGRREFYDAAKVAGGFRKDGKNLIDEWKAQSAKSEYVDSREKLLNLDVSKVDRFMGLFQDSHMLYHLEDPKSEKQPTLSEMTKKAIERLQREEKGYFLFVEGGKIDLAHHDVQAQIALDETIELSKAVKLAREMTSLEDTLIVVSSDHSHTLSISGYPDRKNDIFGYPDRKANDGFPYHTLSYANGRGFDQYYNTKEKKRNDPTSVSKADPHAYFPSTVPLISETHGGEDVGVFASGPWSHLFTGVYEQNTIPHMMAYALCVGEGLKACDK